MFLKQASRADTPVVTRPRVCGFTGRAPIKITPFKADAAAEAQSGDAAGHATATAAATATASSTILADESFQTWLRHHTFDASWTTNRAVSLLQKGPPYACNVQYEAKESAKDVGAIWVPNREFDEKERNKSDKKSRRGWWSAPSEAVLLKMLRVPAFPSMDSRTGRSTTPKRACAMVDAEEQVCVSAEYWLKTYYEARATYDAPCADAGHAKQHASSSSSSSSPAPRGGWSEVAPWRPDPDPEWILDRVHSYSPLPPMPRCPDCYGFVSDQFLECSCAGKAWMLVNRKVVPKSCVQ